MSYDAVNFKIGLAMGHISTARLLSNEPVEPPVEPDVPSSPVAYLYNGRKFPALPYWTTKHKYVVILDEDPPVLAATSSVFSNVGSLGNMTMYEIYLNGAKTSKYKDGKWENPSDGTSSPTIWHKTTYSYVSTPDEIVMRALWSSEDIYCTVGGKEIFVIEGSDPEPVYE